jgi:catechol 2,3-dioxygenase
MGETQPPPDVDAAATSIAPDTRIGAVRLAVADVDGVADFYRDAIGLTEIRRGDGTIQLGAGGTPVVELLGEPGASPRPSGTSGLFHLAILVPDRIELARALRRVADAGRRFSGASDHLVSEALYLDDPEGNGIELYRDRPGEEWPRRNGELQMDTTPLDLQGLLGELPGGDDDPAGSMPPGTRMGHVHLNVGDLEAAEAFYVGVLGFEVTVRGYPRALFVSAGGYHHHIGLNTWAGEGAPPPPPGTRGLRRFEVALPDRGELERVGSRLEGSGTESRRDSDGIHVADPSGNGILLMTRGRSV